MLAGSVRRCDLCCRYLIGRVALFHIAWPRSYEGPRRPDEHIGLRCLTAELTSGVRAICDDCRRIAAEITTILETANEDGHGQAGGNPPVAEPPGRAADGDGPG